MKKIGFLLLTASLLIPAPRPQCYEDLTHQALTRQAVKVATQNGVPAGFFSESQANAIINGAGSKSGEDYTTYDMKPCPVDAVPRPYDWEPLNHFRSPMLGEGPAAKKILQFYQDAVKLWKANKREEAAFILGRALHLIEDMGQPQHASDEKHLDTYKLFSLIGPHLSFLEEFTEAQVTGAALCPERDGIPALVYGTKISGIDTYEGLAGPLTAIMAMESVGLTEGRRYKDKVFTVRQINDWYPGYAINSLCDPNGGCVHLELPFQSAAQGCGFRLYVPGYDFEGSGTQAGITSRIDLGMKLHEGDLQTVAFAGEHTRTLLSPAVGYASGLIAYFWNEVKNPPPVPPKPCDKPKPGGESPDDSVMVKASVAAQSAEMPASFDWHNVCRVGIGKGLASMADYGVSSSLMEQMAALDPNTDPAVAQAMYEHLEALEGRDSGPQNTMPKDVEVAPYVSVWAKGFGGAATNLVEAMREPVKNLEEPEEPVFTDEESLSLLPPHHGLRDADPAKQKVLILPTGSLYGLRSDSVEAQALKGFVEGGGVILSFTQPYGDDFSALPIAAGETIEAAGFKQDLSCFANSAYPTLDHPILSGITSTTVTAGFDGFFREVPHHSLKSTGGTNHV